MNRRQKRELDKIKNRDMDESLSLYNEGLKAEGNFEFDKKQSISTVRLRNLTKMVEEYDGKYRNMHLLPSKDKDRILNEIMSIYIPNVINDIPGILNRMEIMNDYIRYLEIKNTELNNKYVKAYSYLGWTVNKYYDPAEALPDNPAELGDIDPKDIVASPRRKGGVKNPRKKTKSKPKTQTTQA